jgi:hypothetical protein
LSNVFQKNVHNLSIFNQQFSVLVCISGRKSDVLLEINGRDNCVDYFRDPPDRQNSQILRKEEVLGMEKILEIGRVKVK